MGSRAQRVVKAIWRFRKDQFLFPLLYSAVGLVVAQINHSSWLVGFWIGLITGTWWITGWGERRKYRRHLSQHFEQHMQWYMISTEMWDHLTSMGMSMPPLPKDEHEHFCTDETGICDWPYCYERVS